MIDAFPAAVIFDMDGLIFDTESLALRAWEGTAQGFGREFDRDLCRQMIGRSAGDCIALIRQRHGHDYPADALMSAWHAGYDALVAAEGIAVKPGLDELLQLLDERLVPRAVATMTRRERACAKLERAGLLHRFAAVVGGDDVARGKPAPDILLAAAATIGIAPAGCVVLEDSEPGVAAAWAAGMTPLMIPDIYPPSPSLAARGLAVLGSLSEVATHLRELA